MCGLRFTIYAARASKLNEPHEGGCRKKAQNYHGQNRAKVPKFDCGSVSSMLKQEALGGVSTGRLEQ
jgi:hypothetical protein